MAVRTSSLTKTILLSLAEPIHLWSHMDCIHRHEQNDNHFHSIQLSYFLLCYSKKYLLLDDLPQQSMHKVYRKLCGQMLLFVQKRCKDLSHLYSSNSHFYCSKDSTMKPYKCV